MIHIGESSNTAFHLSRAFQPSKLVIPSAATSFARPLLKLSEPMNSRFPGSGMPPYRLVIHAPKLSNVVAKYSVLYQQILVFLVYSLLCLVS
jgi:hypothetical protein